MINHYDYLVLFQTENYLMHKSDSFFVTKLELS